MSAVASLPPGVRTYVCEFVTRARKRAMLRATGQAAALFVGWALAWCLLDRLLQLPPWARTGALSIGLLAIAAILARPLRDVLGRRLDWVEAAAMVERQNPRFAQRLVTFTSRVMGPPEHRGSDDLLHRLLSDVEREAAIGPHPRAVADGSILLPWLALASLIALAAWLARLEAVGLPRLAARFVAPLANIEPVTTTQLVVAPADTKLIQSRPLRVEAVVRGLPPGGVVWLAWREEGGGWFRRVMDRESAGVDGGEANSRFALTLPAVERDLQYHVSGGDAQTRDYSVQVLRPPAVAGFRIRYAYPAYTDRPPLTVTNTDGLIEAPASTEATLTLTATEPLQSALLRLGDEKILMARPRGEGENVRRATFKLTRDVPYEIDLISTRDVAGSGPPGMVVRTVSDRKPLVRLLNAGEGLRLNPRDILPLTYQALDDFGIESLVVRVQVGDGASTDFPVPREGDPRRREGTFNFDLATIKLAVGDVLAVSLVAKDRAAQQESSESLQVLVAPRSIDLETHQRITELEAAAQLAGLVQEELEASGKAFEEAQAQRDKSADASSAAAGRGNRSLTTATDTAVLVRQSLLRAIVRSRAPELASALASMADATQVLTASGEEVFRTNGMAGGDDNAVRENLSRLLERAGRLRERLQQVAQGERAAALLADRENLVASERRAAAEPQAAQRIRQTIQRAAEDVASAARGIGLDPAAPNLDDLLRAKVQAEHALLQSQQPIDFAAAARDWAQQVQRDPLRRLLLDDRLALAGQSEAVRPTADLAWARDLQSCSRAALRIASDAAADKYAGRPVSAGPPTEFASALAALQREHEVAVRPTDVRPPEELKLLHTGAAEARKHVAQWAGETAPGGGLASGGSEPRFRYRRAEETAFRGSADLAAKDYGGARAADRELLRQLAEVGPTTAPSADGASRPAGAAAVAAGPPVPGYLRRDLDRVERLTDKAETIDRVQSEQERLAQETKGVNGASGAMGGATPGVALLQAPALRDRQLDVAQRIEEVTAHDEGAPTAAAMGAAPGNADDPNWRGRATAAVVKAQEQLAAMPQHLTRVREETTALRQAAERAEMASREAAAAPSDRRPALERAARQAEQDRADAEKRFRATARPVLAAEVDALAERLAPFDPEASAAREVIRAELAASARELERGGLAGDTAAVDRAASSAREAIDAAQSELAHAQEQFVARDPLVAAKWFARAAADSLTRSPPDLSAAYRRQIDTSQALGRAWDRTVHEAAAQRLSLVPSLQALYGVPVPAPVLPEAKGGPEAKAAGPAAETASVREWGRLRTREVEELNAPLRETEAPGYERALQLYFESLSKPAGASK